jgi:hypothetical protein
VGPACLIIGRKRRSNFFFVFAVAVYLQVLIPGQDRIAVSAGMGWQQPQEMGRPALTRVAELLDCCWLESRKEILEK